VQLNHCNSECVGIHADKSANGFQALEPVRQDVRQHFGIIGKDVAAGLKLRHDHGSNYMSEDFQTEIAFLGIEASPSFVREPEATARPGASSGRTSRPSRSCASPCSNSPPGTTRTG
jgi:transposase InsO family protein